MISNKKKFLYFVLNLSLVFGFTFAANAASGTPLIMSYQGRLTDPSGNLLGSVSGTTYYFKFSIWDVATSGTAVPNRLWPTSAPGVSTTTVRQGVFTVNIGDTASGYPDTLNYNFNTNRDIYLQVEVSSNGSSFETLSPRQRITSIPFAQVSGAVSGAGQSSFGTTTPLDNTIVSILSTSTNSIPLSIKGFLNQAADLFRIYDSSGNNLFSVNSSGGVMASSTFTVGSSTSISFAVDTSGNVGVGTGAPSRKFDIFDVNSTPQIRISQGASVYGEIQVDSAGDVLVSSTGGNIRQGDENLWVCSGGSCDPSVTPVGEGNVIVENSVIFDNKFKFQQIDASTTVMYDTVNSPILEFDEGQ